MVSRLMADLSNYAQAAGMRRIVEEHSHPKGPGGISLEVSLSLYMSNHTQGGYFDLISKVATVTRTGTRQPPSCGKRPNAVGEGVMALPGIQHGTAVKLTHKESERSVLGQSRRSSRSAGKPRTGRRAAVQGVVRLRSTGGIPLIYRLTETGQHKVSYKDSLGGKAGCGESRPSGLGRAEQKPTEIIQQAAALLLHPESEAGHSDYGRWVRHEAQR